MYTAELFINTLIEKIVYVLQSFSGHINLTNCTYTAELFINTLIEQIVYVLQSFCRALQSFAELLQSFCRAFAELCRALQSFCRALQSLCTAELLKNCVCTAELFGTHCISFITIFKKFRLFKNCRKFNTNVCRTNKLCLYYQNSKR